MDIIVLSNTITKKFEKLLHWSMLCVVMFIPHTSESGETFLDFLPLKRKVHTELQVMIII